MTIRRIYRWDNTKETSTYLVIFLLLWTFNLVSPAMVSQILQEEYHLD